MESVHFWGPESTLKFCLLFGLHLHWWHITEAEVHRGLLKIIHPDVSLVSSTNQLEHIISSSPIPAPIIHPNNDQMLPAYLEIVSCGSSWFSVSDHCLEGSTGPFLPTLRHSNLATRKFCHADDRSHVSLNLHTITYLPLVAYYFPLMNLYKYIHFVYKNYCLLSLSQTKCIVIFSLNFLWKKLKHFIYSMLCLIKTTNFQNNSSKSDILANYILQFISSRHPNIGFQ